MGVDSEKKDKQPNEDKKEERLNENQVVMKNNNYWWCDFDGKDLFAQRHEKRWPVGPM